MKNSPHVPLRQITEEKRQWKDGQRHQNGSSCVSQVRNASRLYGMKLYRNYIRLRGHTVLESDTRNDMEHGTNPGNGSPHHTDRKQKNEEGNPKRNSHEGKFLADVAGWNSGPPTCR
jgi:hypothetical protein